MQGSFHNYSENFAILAKCENFAIDEIFAKLAKFRYPSEIFVRQRNYKFSLGTVYFASLAKCTANSEINSAQQEDKIVYSVSFCFIL